MNGDPARPDIPPESRPGFSDILDLRCYERETRRRLLLGFALAVEALALLFLFCPPLLREAPRVREEPYRTIIADIIEIPAAEENHREGMTAASAPFVPPGRYPAFNRPPADIREFLSRPDMRGDEYRGYLDRQMQALAEESSGMMADSLRRAEPPAAPSAEPEPRITRRPDHHLSLAEEGLKLSDIDSMGTYKGFIIQDPTDKRNVSGFVYIPQVVQGVPLGPEMPNGQIGYGLGYAMNGLAEAVNHYTGIEQKTGERLSLGSPDLFRYPVVYLTSANETAFQLGPSQSRRLGEYLRTGGFLIVDNGAPWKKKTPAKLSLLSILLKSVGGDAEINPIPPDHPIFSSFFDLNGSIPDAASHWAEPPPPPVLLPPDHWGELLRDPALDDLVRRINSGPDCLWGVWIEGRLAAVYIDNGFGHCWRDGYYTYQYRGNEPVLRLGVNLVVFALTQRGGNAGLYVDYTAEGKLSRAGNKEKEAPQ